MGHLFGLSWKWYDGLLWEGGLFLCDILGWCVVLVFSAVEIFVDYRL